MRRRARDGEEPGREKPWRRKSGDGGSQRERPTYRKISGDNSERDPPVLIPNTEVKPLSADGTWLATARESRTSPGSRERKLEERKLLQHAYNGEMPAKGMRA